jgi:hypothetical protein
VRSVLALSTRMISQSPPRRSRKERAVSRMSEIWFSSLRTGMTIDIEGGIAAV